MTFSFLKTQALSPFGPLRKEACSAAAVTAELGSHSGTGDIDRNVVPTHPPDLAACDIRKRLLLLINTTTLERLPV